MLQNKVALVTGAAGGLGTVISKTLAAAGAKVILTDCAQEILDRALPVVQKENPDCIARVMDVMDRDSVFRTFADLFGEDGQLDILVNCAGGSLYTPKEFFHITEEDFDKVIGVNLRGAFYCCQAALPLMVKRNYGRVINISSLSARTASPVAGPAYAAAKGGVLALTRRLAAEFGKYNITINAIAPGTVLNSARMRQLWNEMPPEESGAVLRSIPLGRMSEAEDQANAILFLASDLASYITGISLDVNGGRFMA